MSFNGFALDEEDEDDVPTTDGAPTRRRYGSSAPNVRFAPFTQSILLHV